VLLESGEKLSADAVVLNADLVYAYGNLLPKTLQIETRNKGLQQKEASCSSITFYWSLNRKVPELDTHNIFLAEEYRESFDAIFDKHTLPDEPSFYVNVPSRVDPSAAPEGCDSVVVLVPVGHLAQSKDAAQDASDGGIPADNQRWDEIVDRARAAVLATINSRIRCELPLQDAIAHEIVNTPLTWRSKFNLDKGAILGLGHNFFNVLWFRPSTRAPELKATYFVGASTHPGTGVPIVLAGAKITAEQLLGDLGLLVPWMRRTSKTAASSMAIDRRSDTWLRFGTEEFVVLLMMVLAGFLILQVYTLLVFWAKH
jgi:phytoene desaturase (3,4-didehydrolycopene-forming)